MQPEVVGRVKSGCGQVSTFVAASSVRAVAFLAGRRPSAAYGMLAAAYGLALFAGLPEAGARDLPDLAIESIETETRQACSLPSPAVSMIVTIVNSGPARAQIFTTRDMVRARWRKSPMTQAGVKFANSMRVGDTQRVALKVPLPAGEEQRFGRQELVVTVDPLGVFQERNEANNERMVVVELPPCRS